MDVHCCNCGEPWDQYHLRHDLPPPEEQAAEGWYFGSSNLVVVHCPCCPQNGAVRGARKQTAILRDLADLFGDDEDGLASTLEDFGL